MKIYTRRKNNKLKIVFVRIFSLEVTVKKRSQ